MISTNNSYRDANESFIAVVSNEAAAATRRLAFQMISTNNSYRAANESFIAVISNEVAAATRRFLLFYY